MQLKEIFQVLTIESLFTSERSQHSFPIPSEMERTISSMRCLTCKLYNEKQLRRCVSCKSVYYCSVKCQKLDWTVHKSECYMIKEENALATSSICLKYGGDLSDGTSLRTSMVANFSFKEPFYFILRELKGFLMFCYDKYWDPENKEVNRLALTRMNHLIEAVEEDTDSEDDLDWLRISSIAYGSIMVHNVINEKARDSFKFGSNPWFEAYLFNFGLILDRIKLYAILRQNGIHNVLEASEFPLLRLKSPFWSKGSYHFPLTRLELLSENKKCFICYKTIRTGPVLSPYDPNRSLEIPRLLNVLPLREFSLSGLMDLPKCKENLGEWKRFVARAKTLPQDYVCGVDCEQEALYGRLFSSHPLEPSRLERVVNAGGSSSESGIDLDDID
ncbi:uncharacterized protein [Lepeophtheirus salmonis]|uniref:uncharacterized protein n=1 Tax=Lepeophtheirus salmonis TaxID=72036 RepID=UPI001AE591B5|nr:uncharacterized protein LOC121115016 [Lepeophtheirus salmonis]